MLTSLPVRPPLSAPDSVRGSSSTGRDSAEQMEDGLPSAQELGGIQGARTEEQARTFGGRRDPVCPRQDLTDGEGLKLADTVELFSGNQQEWIGKFVASFVKMTANGYQNMELSINQLDKSFWKHLS